MLLTILCLSVLSFQDADEITQTKLNAFPVADRFSEAIQKYNSVERSESEAMFQEIIEELRGRTGDLDADEHLIMTESLKYMGALNYPDQTEAYFEELIRFDPGHELNSRDLPPKIVEVFNQLKQRLVGKIRVVVKDLADGGPLEEAVFVVDGRAMGTVYNEKTFSVFAGSRELAVTCPNYDRFEQLVDVVPGGESEVTAALSRIASQVFVVTQPAGCEVVLNGAAIGTTDKEAPRQYRAQVAAKGFSLADVGGMVLNDLAPGTYTLELRKPCFRDRIFEFEIGEPRKINFNPIFMDPAEAFINVRAAADTQALVYLDTRRIDFLPVENHRVCPGEYDLRVTFTDGEYIKHITLQDGETGNFVAEPLPSIVWFGLEDTKEGTPPEDMDAYITGLQRWNVHKVNPYDTSQVPVNPFALLFDTETMDAESADVLTRMVKADLYMAARIVRQKVVIRAVEVVFYSPLSKKIRKVSFDFREFQRFKELLQSLDTPPTLTSPWLGVQVARLQGIPGLKVLEVDPAGPLAGQVAVGDIVTSLNGNPLRGPADLIGTTAEGPLVLEINGRQVTVTPVVTIAEIPFPEQGAPQAMLARFEKTARYDPDPLIRNSALFNQARFHLKLGDFKNAFDIFSTLTLSADYGISQGTLLFYQGLCFRRLNESGEATRAFTGVLTYPNATLFDAYGPKAAFWAEAEINNPNQ